MKPDPRQITGIVNTINLASWGGADGSGAPTSNGGAILVSPTGTADGGETLQLTGPGSNTYHSVTIDQFIDRVVEIYRSYSYRTPITVTLLDIPTESFPLIIEISSVVGPA